MRVGFGQFDQPTPEYFRFAAQYGATDVLMNFNRGAPFPSIGGRWELSDLVKLRISAEQYGLTFSAIENVPAHFYDHIMLGHSSAKDSHSTFSRLFIRFHAMRIFRRILTTDSHDFS